MAKLAALKKQIAALTAQDAELDKEIAEKEELCPAGSDKKYCRKLTQKEADCYWINFPDAAKDFSQEGLILNTDNADFAWNFAANDTPSVLKNVNCAQFNPAPKASLMILLL